jgi:hypothetical protein
MSEANLSNDNQAIEPSNGMARRYPPKWAWVFAAICMALPIITVIDGGPVGPSPIGVIGAIACIFVSHNALPVIVRVLLSFLITVGTWGIFISWSLNEMFDQIRQIH